VRIQKAGFRADEFEFAMVQLLPAICGEILDLCILVRHYFREIKIYFFSFEPPRLGALGQMFHFRRIQHRLRRHATAQNAQAADFASALNHRRF
jgi:hypothetical protein